MPLWLRKFTLQQIIDWKKDEKAEYEKVSSQNTNKQTAIGADGKINPSAFQRPTKSSY
jgi:hypothetical protein|tara:strand:+ start:165 stop:338 length:174 start_codon:yes stop_codon:yes gene_type:complete